MNSRGQSPFIIGLVLVSGIAVVASAEEFCIDTAADLVDALIAASGNGEDDVIRVVQGTYLTPSTPPGPFSYFAPGENYGLELLGGYDTTCGSRILDPTNTILDGQNTNLVIEIIPGNATFGDLLFQGFTVQNGNNSSIWAGGLHIGGVSGHAGSVTVEFNIIANNHCASGGGGISGGSDNGLTRIENNLIIDNSTVGGWGAGQITSNGPEFFVTNNTIADNTGTTDGGLRTSGSAPTWITNNIFWGNTGWDLNLGSTTPVVVHNNYGVLVGTPGPGSANNISLDPDFAGSSDYRLKEGSPSVNTGLNTPAGGLPVQDLEGGPRIQGSVVDMGAYESPVLFVDDFEEGDTSKWSATVGGT